jgi:hypothetical protein
MKKISFILLVLYSLLSTISAQTSKYGYYLHPDKKSMEIINSAEYIFEGEAIEDKSYYNKDSSRMFTSVKVKVNAVYKGNLTEGEIIELVEEGGTIGLDERVDPRYSTSSGYRTPYILLCNKVLKLPVANKAYNLPVKLHYVSGEGHIEYVDNPDAVMVGLNKIQFKTKEDVENLLLKVPGVTLPPKKQVEVQVESKPPADTLSIEEFFNQNNLDGKRAKQILENRKKKR